MRDRSSTSRRREGAEVKAGDLLFVVSAMKMETSVAAPCAGTVATLASLSVGDAVDGSQVLAVIKPAAGAAKAAPPATADEGWTPMLDKVAALQAIAAQARWRPARPIPAWCASATAASSPAASASTLLLDRRQLPRGRQPGGLRHATTRTATSPSSRRPTTSAARAASRAALHRLRRRLHLARRPRRRRDRPQVALPRPALDRAAHALDPPARRLVGRRQRGHHGAQAGADGESAAKESTGAIKAGRPRVVGGGGSFLPGHLGSTFYAEQLATVPVVNLLLGSVVGIGAAKAVLGHFSVMVRDIAQLFVAGPPVVSHAMGYDVTKEDLGGWHIHCRNGSVDNLAETEEEAMAQTRRFLSYLPSSVYEAPPVTTIRRSRRPPRGGAADPGPAQAHDDVRRAPGDPAAGRQGLVLRDRAAVGHRPGHRLRALRTAIRWASSRRTAGT